MSKAIDDLTALAGIYRKQAEELPSEFVRWAHGVIRAGLDELTAERERADRAEERDELRRQELCKMGTAYSTVVHERDELAKQLADTQTQLDEANSRCFEAIAGATAERLVSKRGLERADRAEADVVALREAMQQHCDECYKAGAECLLPHMGNRCVGSKCAVKTILSQPHPGDELRDSLKRYRQALGLAISMIRGGEPMSAQAEAVFAEALNAGKEDNR